MISKKGWVYIFLLCLLIFLTGCEKKDDLVRSDKLLVYTSFYPLYDFSQKIAGDLAEVVNMVPIGVEPHEWEPSTRDIVQLNQSDLFFYNGMGMEGWVDKIVMSLQGQKPKVVETAKNLPSERGDPHVWLNPLFAKVQMEKIKNAFCTVDPEHAKIYERNYQTQVARLADLDRTYKETIAPLKKKEIVVAHQAFGYLCRAYGLKQIAIQGLSTETEPNPKKMKEIIDVINARQIKVIFAESLIDPKLVKNIAEQTDCQIEVLNALEGLSQEEEQAGKEYFSVMADNLEKLKMALE